jgi:hypothetical protein
MAELTKVTTEELRAKVKDHIEEVFAWLQEKENATGDILPECDFELDRIENELTNLIAFVVSLAKRPPEKKTYRVWAVCESDCYIDVEAESEDEAKCIAEEIDGSQFTTSDSGDWRITKACQLNN